MFTLCHNELSKLLTITEEPLSKELTRWNDALPKFNKELKFLNQELFKLDSKNIYFNSNWVGALSIKDCISKSKEISTFL